MGLQLRATDRKSESTERWINMLVLIFSWDFDGWGLNIPDVNHTLNAHKFTCATKAAVNVVHFLFVSESFQAGLSDFLFLLTTKKYTS